MTFSKNLVLILFVLFLIKCTSEENNSISNPEEPTNNIPLDSLIVLQLDSTVVPFGTEILQVSDDDLNVLSGLNNSQFVGMGEATHGTKEFFEMKQRVFRYLVENQEYRVFVLETDMGSAYYLNRYIQSGTGDINELMRDTMYLYVWKTEEMKQLIEWMKSYNSSAATDEKIYFVGNDCQSYKFNIDRIDEYIETNSTGLMNSSTEYFRILDQIKTDSFSETEPIYTNMSSERMQEISDSLVLFESLLSSYEQELVSATSDYEFKIHKQLIKNVWQTHRFLISYYEQDFTVNLRDQYMADNAIWAGTELKENSKVFVWSHNGHIQILNDEYTLSNMGYHLKTRLGDEYQAIALTFSNGSFRARAVDNEGVWGDFTGFTISGDPLESSYEHFFNKSDHSNFIMKVANVNEFGALYNWMDNTRSILSIGAGYIPENYEYYFYPMNILQTSDYVIHISHTHESTPLQ